MESQQLYPINKYHIYLVQFDFFPILRGGFQGHLKISKLALGNCEI